MVGLQMLDLLFEMHNLGIVHGDIKPENIVVGVDDPGKICLIDFGLATRFRSVGGKHIERTNTGRFSGSLIFASIGTCRGTVKTARDDIESFIYVLIYLLNDFSLPWAVQPPDEEFSFQKML